MTPLLRATLWPALALSLLQTSPTTVPEEIRRRVESLRNGHAVEVFGVTIPPQPRLAQLYEARAFAPLWVGPEAARDLAASARFVTADGLDPARYDATVLASLPDRFVRADSAADADLLRSHALIRLTNDLHYGRVDPSELDPSWRLPTRERSLDATTLQDMIASGRLAERIAALRPNHFIYQGLQRALADYRAIRGRGGWPSLPGGPILQLDSAGTRIPVLRRRLAMEGDLPAGADTVAETFDAVLDSAVRRFQHRHALNEDGVVGRATLAELNVPVDARIDQIRINLERARWTLHGLADTFVAANIAGQRIYLVRGGAIVWETRGIVGKEYSRTPIFTAPMRYLVLNPTWTVPTSIAGEILTAIRRDASYLEREGMRVIDRAGRTIDPTSLDFSRWSGRSFPYVFRQDPGPRNALGFIKFMFPNEYDVYLHDTPARSLFDREDRTFSHGCIRVQDPLRLAELLLDDPAWTRAALESAIASRQTRTLSLARPIPMLILYWTASADLHGELHFYRDVYRRDAALLRALDRETD